MVRIGVIGCGRIAERHVDAYRRLSASVVVADQIPDLAPPFARRFGAEAAARPQDLLDDDRIDAIDVCVPTPDHASLVEAGLGAGKHVFCEKPLCSSIAEWDGIEQAQRRSGKQVMVGYLYRFHPAYRFAKEIVDQDILEHLHLGIFRLGGRGNSSSWKHDLAAGGGASLEMLAHILDLAGWLLGPLDSARLLAREVLLPVRHIAGEAVRSTAEDYIVARLRAGQTEVLLESDLVTPSYMNYTELHGQNGSLFTTILAHLPTVLYCKEARGIYDIGNHIRTFPQTNLFDLELGQFVSAVEGRTEVRADIEGSRRVVAVIEQLRLEAPTQL